MTAIANAWWMVVLEKAEMYLVFVLSGGKIEDSIKKTIDLSAFICSTIFCHYEKHTLFAYRSFAPNTETALLSSYLIVFVFSLKLSHM